MDFGLLAPGMRTLMAGLLNPDPAQRPLMADLVTFWSESRPWFAVDEPAEPTPINADAMPREAIAGTVAFRFLDKILREPAVPVGMQLHEEVVAVGMMRSGPIHPASASCPNSAEP